MSAHPSQALLARLPDTRLPQLELAWSDERVRALLEREVLPALLPGAGLAAVERTRTRYQPGQRCVALYDLAWQGPARGLPASATLSTSAEGPACAEHCNGRAVVDLPAQGFTVELFPTDAGLPAMAFALDRALMARRLGVPEPSLAIELLRYLPHERCVLRYRTPRGNVVGKIYPTPDGAAAAVELLGTLRPLAAAQGLVMPALLGHVPEWSLVLMEHVASSPWEGALKRKRGDDEARAAVTRAAAALATFHGLRAPVAAPERSLATEQETLAGRLAALQTVAPELARRGASVLAAAVAGADPVDGPRCLSHGDFAPSQLLDVGERLALIDVDMVCPADPALDVANFQAKLHRRAVSKEEQRPRELAAHFLEQYCLRRPEHRVDERVAAFRALRLARMAVDTWCRSPPRHAGEGEESLAVRLVAEAVATLEGGPGC